MLTQPLNYTPKAIVDLMRMAERAKPVTPLTAQGISYLIDKLRQAQVFVLSDGGQLLDRSRPRPELPGVVMRLPFPVVALEYMAATELWSDPVYSASKCSKRIALAWDHSYDLPPSVEAMLGRALPAGVIVASIAFYDQQQCWMPIGMAMHVDYEEGWGRPPEPTDFHRAAVASGRISPAVANAAGLKGSVVPFAPEAIQASMKRFGGQRTIDMLTADLLDENAAYMDLCWALACKNVTTRHHDAPARLNAQRVKSGKLPLYGFHVLELAGSSFGGQSTSASNRNEPRAHLRRGHIRRLTGDRVTWVNQAMVRGRGFVDKVYAL